MENFSTLEHIISALDGSWEAVLLAPGTSYTRFFDVPGIYEYVSMVDGIELSGTIIVEEAIEAEFTPTELLEATVTPFPTETPFPTLEPMPTVTAVLPGALPTTGQSGGSSLLPRLMVALGLFLIGSRWLIRPAPKPASAQGPLAPFGDWVL